MKTFENTIHEIFCEGDQIHFVTAHHPDMILSITQTKEGDTFRSMMDIKTFNYLKTIDEVDPVRLLIEEINETNLFSYNKPNILILK